MLNPNAMNQDVWTIVLAAGAGKRLASVTGGVPKQFWRPEGSRSLLEETVARVQRLVDPERTVTIVGADQRHYVEAIESLGHLGEITFQPMDRGTATGV